MEFTGIEVNNEEAQAISFAFVYELVNDGQDTAEPTPAVYRIYRTMHRLLVEAPDGVVVCNASITMNGFTLDIDSAGILTVVYGKERLCISRLNRNKHLIDINIDENNICDRTAAIVSFLGAVASSPYDPKINRIQ